MNYIGKGYTALVKRLDNGFVRKEFKKNYLFMKNREIQFLEVLKGYNYFPKCLGFGNTYIDMDYCGEQPKNLKLFKDQGQEILNILKETKIKHGDIRPQNFLILNGVIRLIDYGWSLFEWEDKSVFPIKVPEILGGVWQAGHQWNNEIAMERCFA